MKSNRALKAEYEKHLCNINDVGVLEGNKCTYIYKKISDGEYIRKCIAHDKGLNEELSEKGRIYIGKIFGTEVKLTRPINEDRKNRNFACKSSSNWKNVEEGLTLHTGDIIGRGYGVIEEEERIGFYISPIQNREENIPFKIYGYIRLNGYGDFHLDDYGLKEVMIQLKDSPDDRLRELYKIWINLYKDLTTEGRIISCDLDMSKYLPSWFDYKAEVGKGINIYRKKVLIYFAKNVLRMNKVSRYYSIPQHTCKRLVDRLIEQCLHKERELDKMYRVKVKDGFGFYNGNQNEWRYYINTPIGLIKCEGQEYYHIKKSVENKINTMARLKNVKTYALLQDLWKTVNK